MKDISVVVYTMRGCPHCYELKKILSEKGIEFYDRDIEKYSEEYDLFSEITKSDLVPALLIVEGDESSHESFLYVPDKDFMELNEVVDIVKKHQGKLGII